MYWNEAHSPQIEILLSNEDLKLTDLLNNDDVLQQCKGQNKTLVAYLLRLDVLEELIDLITKEPPEDVNESLRFKYPNIACEVLTSDLPALKERIVAQHNLLDKLFSFLEQDPPLNPLLTSFFTKTFGMLFAQGGEQNWFTYQCTCIQLLGFIKSRNGFLDNIYKHLGLRVIVDLLFSIITNVSADDIKGDLYTWLNEQKLIENLIGILGQDDKSYKNNNIAQFLSELIKWGRTHRQTVLQEVGSYNATCYSDPLLQLLESEQCTELLLQKMLSSSNTQSYSTIESGINILLTILDNPIINQPVSDIALQTLIEFEKEHHRRIIGNVLKAIVPYVSDFHNILINPTNKPDIKTTIAAISPPFGNVRLQVCTLLTVLIETGYPDIIKLICETEFYNTLLKLFKQYCWNNILHNLVKRCFTFVFPPPPPPPPIKVDVDVVIDSQNESIIDGGSPTVVTNSTTITEPTITTTKAIITDIQNHLIVNCKIVPKFIDCWMHNNTIQFEQKRPRLGYMGHLIEMFNLLVCQLSSSDDLRALIETNLNDEELKNWNIIANLNDGELMNEIGKQKTLLANIDLNAVDTTEVVPVEENPDDSIQNTADIDDGNDDYVCEQFEEACEQNSNDYNMDMAAEEWMDSDSLSSNKLPYNLAPYVSNYLNGSDMNDINNSSHHHHHHNPFETKGFNATTNDFDNYSTDNFSSDNFADFDTYFNTYGNPFDDNDNNNNNNNNHHDNDPFSNVNHFKNNNNNNGNNFELTQSADDYNKLNDKLLPPTFEHNENNVILNNNHNHNAIDSRDTNSKFNNIDVNALWESIKETNNKSDTKSYNNNNNNNNSNTSTIADDDVFKIENHLAMLNFDNSIDFSTNNEHHLNDTNNKNHSVQENIFSNNIENFVPSSLNNNNHDNNINDIDVKIKTDTSDKLSDVIINNNVQIHNNNNNNINLESNLDDKNNDNDNDEIDGGKKFIIQNENDYENKLSSVHKSGQYINEGSSDAVLLLPANAKLIITSSCNNGSVNNNREDDVPNTTTTIMAAGITDTTTFITSSNQNILKKNDNDQTITKNIINTIGSCDDNNLSGVTSDVTIPSSSSSSSSSTEITNDLTAATAASTTDNSTIND